MLPLGQPTFGDEEIEALREVLASGWVAGQGPRGRELEDRFAALTGAEHVVALANCTAALHLSMIALEVGPGDEVIVADYTYPATGHSVRYVGAHPVFADVRPDTATIDPEKVESLVTDKTRGIIAVDVFGQCADYDELQEIADRRGLFLVEDAAPSAGASYGTRMAGNLADVACFSLHARKGITSGEGGLLATNDERLAAIARKLSCFGVESAFDRHTQDKLPVPVFTDLGYNYKLSDIQAAVALVQLDRLPDLLQRRRRIAASYAELLADIPAVTLPVTAAGRDHTWQAYVVTLDRSLDRSRIAMALRSAGVQANIGTYASHRQPVYRDPAQCEVSADLFDRHLAIPMHANMSDADVERVSAELHVAIDRELATAAR